MQKNARQLGRYHVLDRVAFGGMAEIFRAITFDDEGKGHIVAIKQVLPHYAEDREFIDMLVDEAKMVSMLVHPNIVQIYEFGHVDEFYFVAMEYVWGKDLRAVLERCRNKGLRIPYEVSAHLMSEALAGLDTAHRLLDSRGCPAGLVHRDFSPSNILISYSGDIKICDFGIAKATFSRIETKTGVIKGKVKYMSPEQAFGRKLDHRSDLFSAGSVFYEMMTNEPPFMAKNEIDLIFLVRDAQITPPAKRSHDIPKIMEEVIYRSMARSRSARYQSAAEFRHSLQGYLRKRGMGNWRAELGRFMQSVYAEEIKKERAVLNEYTIDPTHIAPDLGKNLIADVLGRDAAFTKFNPFPTRAYELPADSAIHDASTSILELPESQDVASMMAETADPQMPLEDQATMILNSPEVMDDDEEDPTDFYSSPDQAIASAVTGEVQLPVDSPNPALSAPPPLPALPLPIAPPPAPPPQKPGLSESSHERTLPKSASPLQKADSPRPPISPSASPIAPPPPPSRSAPPPIPPPLPQKPPVAPPPSGRSGAPPTPSSNNLAPPPPQRSAPPPIPQAAARNANTGTPQPADDNSKRERFGGNIDESALSTLPEDDDEQTLLHGTFDDDDEFEGEKTRVSSSTPPKEETKPTQIATPHQSTPNDCSAISNRNSK